MDNYPHELLEVADETIKSGAKYIEELKGLLKHAVCPECDGSGGKHDGFGNAAQCKWCFDRNNLVGTSQKTFYIAGPMRGRTNYNFSAFFAAQETLERQGFKVINPAQLDLDNGVNPYSFPKSYDWNKAPGGDSKAFARRDLLAIIDRCSGVYLLRGWENSVGARAERSVANWIGLEIIKEQK